MFPPGFEPGTFRVLSERDDHYTTETGAEEIICPPTLHLCNKPLHVHVQLISQCSDNQGARSLFKEATLETMAEVIYGEFLRSNSKLLLFLSLKGTHSTPRTFKTLPCIGRESDPGLPHGKREFFH